MRYLITALLCCAFAQAAYARAESAFTERLDRYKQLGWPPAEIIAGLERWFGVGFELATYDGKTYVQQVSRRPDRTIYRLEIVGRLDDR